MLNCPVLSRNLEKTRASYFLSVSKSTKLDALTLAFDAALITFDDAGKILISPSLRDSDAKALGIFTSLRLKQIDRRHQHYLHYHRDLFSVRANHSLEQADKRS